MKHPIFILVIKALATVIYRYQVAVYKLDTWFYKTSVKWF